MWLNCSLTYFFKRNTNFQLTPLVPGSLLSNYVKLILMNNLYAPPSPQPIGLSDTSAQNIRAVYKLNYSIRTNPKKYFIYK